MTHVSHVLKLIKIIIYNKSMKLSFVLCFKDQYYEEAQQRLLEITEQANENTQLVLVHNLTDQKLSKKFYKLVEENKFKFIDILDVSQLTSQYNLLNNLFYFLKTDYVYFVDPNAQILPNFIKTIVEIIENKKNKKAKIDLINFGLKMNQNRSSNDLIKIDFNKFINLKENKEIIAFTPPFLSNKIFRLKFLKRSEIHFSNYFENNDFSFVWRTLSIAYNVYFVKEDLICAVNQKNKKQTNYISFSHQWEEIIQYYKIQNRFNLYYQEIEFAFILFIHFYAWWILYIQNCFNKENFQESFNKFIKLLKNNFNFAKDENIYLNTTNNETLKALKTLIIKKNLNFKEINDFLRKEYFNEKK